MNALRRRVDASSLAVLRISFGAIVTWEVWRAFDGNLIRADYDLPQFHFTWWLFSWVRPLPGVWIYVAFAAVGLAAAALAIGLFTRWAAALTCLGLTYWILMEKAAYLNHRYLAASIAFLLAVVPSGARWSVDALRSPAAGTAPEWSVWLVRFQVGVPYFFAGIAKLNYDWMFRAEPLAIALRTGEGALAHVLAWGSAGLDLTAPFLLLHRRTRVPAFAFALAFHFINSRFFDIGMFPWLMIVGTTVFFDPAWPAQALRMVRSGRSRDRWVIVIGGVVGFVLGGSVPESFAFVRAIVGGFGVATLAFHIVSPRSTSEVTPGRTPPRVLQAFVAIWITTQLLIPLRHFVIPGNANWTEEGNRFAWHMLLRSTRATVSIEVVDPATSQRWTEDLTADLTRYQISKLRYPDLLHQYAHHLETKYRSLGHGDIEVYANVIASLNGRPRQRLVRRTFDLTRMPRPYIGHASWVLPLAPFDALPSGGESGRRPVPGADG
ncbi:MAG: HTTM domain-containing protein [Actinomycetota bacterium]